MKKSRKRVFIVDHNKNTQRLLKDIISRCSQTHVVGSAENAHIARRLIKELNPDVIIVDVALPGMNGLEFLSKIMKLRPTPVIMICAADLANTQTVASAHGLGAIGFIKKPNCFSINNLKRFSTEIHKILSETPTGEYKHRYPATTVTDLTQSLNNAKKSVQLIAIGASTGGTVALEKILRTIPVDSPGIVIVQHIQHNFVDPFIRKLNTLLPLVVQAAKDAEVICDGHVYIAPASKHLRIERLNNHFRCCVQTGEPRSNHLPSVDVLFESVATEAAGKSVAVLLTGMGRDGANGLLKINHSGSRTIIQNKESSIVWGMPGKAYEIGAADQVSSLEQIPKEITRQLSSL